MAVNTQVSIRNSILSRNLTHQSTGEQYDRPSYVKIDLSKLYFGIERVKFAVDCSPTVHFKIFHDNITCTLLSN